MQEAMTIRGSAADISARLERLPLEGPVLRIVAILALGCFVENYFLQMTAYIAPSLISDGLYNRTASSLFDIHSVGFFIFSGFAGMGVGSVLFGSIADRFGRRSAFFWAMFLYAFASLVMAFQTTAEGLALWRFISSIGLGLELVVVNTMVSELVSSRYRGRAVAFYQFISLLGAPVVAFVSMRLTPVQTSLGGGWRLVTLVGVALIGLVLWFRRRLPESPRWLAAVGRYDDADRFMRAIESEVERTGVVLPEPVVILSQSATRRSAGDLFKPPYLQRTVMFMIQQLFMPIGFYGFSSWVPTLLIAQGVEVTQSLLYAAVIALATPATPLLMWFFADRVDRKWLITVGGVVCAILMLGFSMHVNPVVVVLFGVGVTCSKTIIITAIAGYMPECYPTTIRGAGHGMVYGVSRVTAALSGPIIAYVLATSGAQAVSALIAGSFFMVALVTFLLGPRVRGKTLEELNP